MVNDKIKFDFEESDYKSCFARSVLVNSQYHKAKSPQTQQMQYENGTIPTDRDKGAEGSAEFTETVEPLPSTVSQVSKEVQMERLNGGLYFKNVNSVKRSSTYSNRPKEKLMPNFCLQSQVETLQWQLKQVDENREMYKAFLKQVVVFLEKAHRSLESHSSKLISNQKQAMPRTCSEHQMNSTNDSKNSKIYDLPADYGAFRDFTWRRRKKQPDDTPPEKLSQEAFLLLRTAQSLLNTREPDLARISKDSKPDDQAFLLQLAKEFPRRPETHQTTQLNSTVFNRKSLQRHEFKRSSLKEEPHNLHKSDSGRGSVAESDNYVLPLNDSCRGSVTSRSSDRFKHLKNGKAEPEKSSISSTEDESGFSSMNSFQEVGLPLISSTIFEETSSREALMKSMLNKDVFFSEQFSNDGSAFHRSLSSNSDSTVTLQESENNSSLNANSSFDSVRLWKMSENVCAHKRWSSTPMETKITKTADRLEVLWV